MKILRHALIASLTLGVATPVLAGCAERPGTKKKDENEDDKKSDDKKADKKADEKDDKKAE